MTQPASTPSLESFFAGGGGKSFSWKDKPIGTFIKGVIKSVGEPQQATDPATGLPALTRQQKPRIQVRITLQTAERDPQDPEDDGTRNLYVGGFMTGAIGDAMRKAGAPDGPPRVGAELTVWLSERESNGPSVNPTNKFVAQYVPGAPVATQEFFQAVQPPTQQAFVPPQAPPYVPPVQQYAPPVQQAVMQAPPVQQAPAVAEPPRPAAIAEAAWAVMDLATKQAVANTVGGGLTSPGQPPF